MSEDTRKGIPAQFIHTLRNCPNIRALPVVHVNSKSNKHLNL